MKPRHTLTGVFVAVLGTLIATGLFPQQPAEVGMAEVTIPRRIGTVPELTGIEWAWISARELVAADGSLRPSAFPRLTRKDSVTHLQEAVRASREARAAGREPECHRWGVTSHPPTPLPGNFLELVSDARVILRGVVTEIDGGLYLDRLPALLLRVEVSNWIKVPAEYRDRVSVYVPYPAGEFRLGPARICFRDPNWPPPPRIGDQLLVFARLASWADDGSILQIDQRGHDLVFETAAALAAPRFMAQIPEIGEARSLHAIEERVVAALRRPEPRH